MEVGLFYAIQICSGNLGTEESLLTVEYARVLRKNGEVIPGVYCT